MEANYFVEQWPQEPGQLIYVFTGKGDVPIRSKYSQRIARYLGEGVIVDANLQLVNIEAGLAWEPCNEILVPASIR